MTTKEEVEYCLAKIDSVLAYDFITTPVKESLTDIKTHLESVKASL